MGLSFLPCATDKGDISLGFSTTVSIAPKRSRSSILPSTNISWSHVDFLLAGGIGCGGRVFEKLILIPSVIPSLTVIDNSKEYQNFLCSLSSPARNLLRFFVECAVCSVISRLTAVKTWSRGLLSEPAD